jgi:hypothetical protein
MRKLTKAYQFSRYEFERFSDCWYGFAIRATAILTGVASVPPRIVSSDG